MGRAWLGQEGAELGRGQLFLVVLRGEVLLLSGLMEEK